MINNILNVAPVVISLAAVIVSACSIRSARRSVLNGAYFSEKTASYAEFLRMVAHYTFHLNDISTSDKYSLLFRLKLFAPDDVTSEAMFLLSLILDYPKSAPAGFEEVLDNLVAKMQCDLKTFEDKR